jgi:hypothetical protein
MLFETVEIKTVTDIFVRPRKRVKLSAQYFTLRPAPQIA